MVREELRIAVYRSEVNTTAIASGENRFKMSGKNCIAARNSAIQ